MTQLIPSWTPGTTPMPDTFNLDPAADDQKLLAQVIDYYHAALKNTPEALDFLRKKGINNPEALSRFRLGYSDRSLGTKLPTHHVKAGRLLRERLQQLGLYRDSGHEHFRGCLTFPVMAGDGTGRIVDLYGRKMLGTKLHKRCPLDVYLTSDRHGVWNVEAFRASEEMILCPSVFDALTCWSYGYRNVTCTLGPNALTADHLAAFTEFRIKRVLVVDLGIVQQLLDAGIDVYSLQLPPTLSINTYALQAGDPAEALGALLRTAHWLGRGQAVPVTTTPVNMIPMPLPTPALIEPAVESPSGTDCGQRSAEAEPMIELPSSTACGQRLADDEPHQDQDSSTPSSEPTISPPSSPPSAIRTASPLPPAPRDINAEVGEDEVKLTFGNRQYRVRGWTRNLAFDVLEDQPPRHQRRRPLRGHLRLVLGQAPAGLHRAGGPGTQRGGTDDQEGRGCCAVEAGGVAGPAHHRADEAHRDDPQHDRGREGERPGSPS